MSDQVAWLRAQIEADKASAERREGPTAWFDDETIARCDAELALLNRCEQAIKAEVGDIHPDARKLARYAIRTLASGYRRRAGWKDQWSV